jgi:predicted nucleic acid-binding protein
MTIFADTHYWIALANPRDEWHVTARETSRRMAASRIVTCDEVLSEFLAFYAGRGPYWRSKSTRVVHKIYQQNLVDVIPQSRYSFKRGLKLYESRIDKCYSLTDCISMETMRLQGITNVLTHDHHFEQEGFVLLLV